MKKILFFFFILFSNSSFAQSWTTVGFPDFAAPGADYIFSAVSPNGEPYVVYRDQNWIRATVKKFDGNNWVTVGNPDFSSGEVICTTMAFDPVATPYVAFTSHYKASVMKFDGSNWVSVGQDRFTPGYVSFTSIAIDHNGTPYIAFRDQGDTVHGSWPNGYRASVMKFDGANWVYVGAPGFSSNGTFGGAAYTSLAIDSSGTLYIAFVDDSNAFKATVMKFDGNNWVNVGSAGIVSTGSANNTSIVIDSQGTPYVGYVDGANGGKATVKKFDGSNWISVGITGFSPGAASYTSLAIDNNDILYLTFKDYAHANKATVMTFNGSSWVMLGNAGFSTSDVEYTTIAIDKINGVLFATYEDVYDASTLYPKYNATVMKFAIRTDTKDAYEKIPVSMTIYPNPASRLITINIASNKTKRKLSLKVNNASGKTFYSEDLKESPESFSKQIDLSSLPKGIYFVELYQDNKHLSQKLVLQ